MPNMYRKACPSCSRVFTHPPAFSVHVKSCGANSSSGGNAGAEQSKSATCRPASAAAAPTRPAVGPPPKAEGEAVNRAPGAPAPAQGGPLYFQQLESELLNSEIKFKDAKERAAYVKDMAQQRARNSDNIVVDFGWKPKNEQAKRPAASKPARTKSSEDSTEDSSDFEKSDEESGPAAGVTPQPAPAPAPAPARHGKPKTTAAKRGDGTVDGKYAALIDKVGTTPDHARLAAMSLDDLRFLLRKNGTSSHNMLKMPVVSALARIASTTGLRSSVELTSEPTGRKRQRSAAPSPNVTEKKRKEGGVALTPAAAAAVAPSRASKRERKQNQLGSDYVDPSSIDQGYFHASIGGEPQASLPAGAAGAKVAIKQSQKKKKKKAPTQKLVAQSKLDEIMSKYTYLDSPGFASPFQQQSKVRIQAASDSEEEEEFLWNEASGEGLDGSKDREAMLSEMLRKPIYIPPTSGEDLFAAYLKMS